MLFTVYLLFVASLAQVLLIFLSAFLVTFLQQLLVLYSFMQPFQPWYAQVDSFCLLWFFVLSSVHLYLLNAVYDLKQTVSLLEKKLPFYALDIVLSFAFCMIASLVIWLLFFLYDYHSDLCWYLFANWCFYLAVVVNLFFMSFILHWVLKHLVVKRSVSFYVTEAGVKKLASYSTITTMTKVAGAVIAGGTALVLVKGANDVLVPFAGLLVGHIENTSQLQTHVQVERQIRIDQFESMMSDAMKQLKDENAQLKLENQQLTNKLGQFKRFAFVPYNALPLCEFASQDASSSSTSNLSWYCRQLQAMMQKND
jgi:hypothetical protein